MLSQSPDIRLSCEVEIAGEALRLRFEVDNGSAEPVFVFDGGGPYFKAHVVCDGGGHDAHVLIGVPPLPPFPVYWMFHPLTTRLAPGEAARREISLSLPLREVSSYYPRDHEAYTTVSEGTLTLFVDVLRESKARPSEAGPRGDIERVTCALPLPRPVELLRRHDAFDRI